MLLHTVFLCLLLAYTSAIPVKKDAKSSKTSPEKKDLDIYSFHIKSTVSSRYALTVITSRVANRANESREVVFHVELPKNAFISKFSMNIDGHVYDGVVKEKEEAQTQYTQAVSRGQSAGLVSTVGRTLEHFQTSVTVAALSKVTFELTYEELLKRKLGQYELLIKARPTQVVKDFKIEVKVYEQQGIAFLKTQGSLIAEGLSSALNTNVSEKQALVQFTPSVEQQCPSCEDPGLNGDLILFYDVNRPQSKGEIQVSRGYFVHYFAPTDLPRIPKNVVFIIDQSGSMHGRKIEQTREALLKILGDLPEEDHFALITFDNQVFNWKDDLVPANSDYLTAARSFVRHIRDRGSTDINSAVLAGVQMLNRFHESHPKSGTASILILLTDGDPTSGVTNLKQIQANVKEAIGKKYTLYCLGFGYDVNYEFLEKMALENEGVARRIYADSDAALQLQGFYEEVATPLLLDIQLNYGGASNLTQTRFAQYYNGSEIVVSGQITDNDLDTLTAEVKANKKGELVLLRATPEKKKPVPEDLDFYIFEMYIQRLWAYLTVQQHLERALLLTGEEKSEMKAQALALALKYSFVTPLTSMVVTKPEGDQQVAHKPKEGIKPIQDSVHRLTQMGVTGSIGAAGDPGNSGRNRGIAFYIPQARPGQQAPPGQPGPPGPPFHAAPPFFADFDYNMMSVPSLIRPDRHYYDPPVQHYIPVRPAPTFITVVEPTVSHQKIRVILPARSSEPQTSPGPDTICFDLDFHGDPIYHLMEDKTADLLIKGQVRGMGQKGFNTISLQMAPAWHMQVNTTTFTFGMEQYSWTQKNPTILNKDRISIHHADRELEVHWGDVFVKILLHKEGEDYFLWPDIRGSNKTFTGLIGLFQDGHVEKLTPTSANLRIQGQVVPASRDTAVDYRNLHGHTVDCWLFQYQSVIQGNPLLQIKPTH